MTAVTLSRSSSPTTILRGSQQPTKLVMPDYDDTDWKTCHALNAAGGIEMLEWQDGIMCGWLATNSLGRWAASTCGGSLSRQNGKSLGLVVPRANYGMVILGEEVLYTSHLQKTSTETFESVATFFDQPALRKHVKDIKTALGREQVVLKKGGRIKFLARTRNGGRGQHGDLLIFDEALELDADSQASFRRFQRPGTRRLYTCHRRRPHRATARSSAICEPGRFRASRAAWRGSSGRSMLTAQGKSTCTTSRSGT